MLLGIHKLSIVEFAVIKVEKTFVFFILQNRVPEVNAVFELLDQWRCNSHLRFSHEAFKEVKDIAWLRVLTQGYRVLAVGFHDAFVNIFYFLGT